LLSNFLYSTLFITILSLTTFIFISFQSLKIVNSTVVHFGHLIQEIASASEVVSKISLSSALRTTSHHFNQAFSDGDPGIGETIFNNQGFSIST